MDHKEIKEKFPNHIVETFNGYIIIAQDVRDLKVKRDCISRGDTIGFWREKEVEIEEGYCTISDEDYDFIFNIERKYHNLTDELNEVHIRKGGF